MARERLDPTQTSEIVRRFQEQIESNVVGQRRAIEEIVSSFSRLTSGIRSLERPILTLLFMGPTGVGKTETVKMLAQTLFGNKRAFVRINCQEFASPHQVAKLLGAPPGYVGSDVEPMLSQKNIDKHHKEAFEKKVGIFRQGLGKLEKVFPGSEEHYLSLLLFDEVEKADPVLWNSILGILDDGHLTLGNNEEVDFTRSIIILTSNVGSTEMSSMIGGRIGFALPDDSTLDRDIEEEVLRVAKAVFPFEFLNRFDAIVVFKTLRREHLHRILDIYLNELHARAVDSEHPFILDCTPPVRRFLVDAGTDPSFGARPLRRVFSRYVVNPLSNLISTAQVKPGDFIRARLQSKKIVFDRVTGKSEGIMVARHTP